VCVHCSTIRALQFMGGDPSLLGKGIGCFSADCNSWQCGSFPTVETFYLWCYRISTISGNVTMLSTVKTHLTGFTGLLANTQ